ncbi:MAG: alpha/beta hydrolase [Hellea sp.]
MTLKHLMLSTLSASLLIGCSSDVSSDKSKDTSGNAVTEAVSIDVPNLDEAISAGSLSGLYRNAGEGSPVILIVPGSGPTDLNGNNSLGVTANSYKLLAETLSGDGISTIRVDKRGMFSSAGAGNPNDVTVDTYAQDYKNWAAAIRAETGQSCVYMLGHSEGALMVTAAAIGNDDVCGLILIAGVGRSFGDVLREQLKANPANFIIMKEAEAAIAALEAGEQVETGSLHPGLQGLFGRSVQGFLISLMQADPAALAKEANKDTLIIQGQNDLQVSVKDAEKLAAATGGKLVIIEGMNHVLKDAPKSRMKNLAVYKRPDLPISEGVSQAISDFVNP